MDKTELTARLEFRRAALDQLREAYMDLASGRIASYTIGSRTITYKNLPELDEIINKKEKELDKLTALAKGKAPRKAVGVIPRD